MNLIDKNQSLTNILVDGKINIEGKCSQAALILFRMGLFGAADKLGEGGKKAQPP